MLYVQKPLLVEIDLRGSGVGSRSRGRKKDINESSLLQQLPQFFWVEEDDWNSNNDKVMVFAFKSRIKLMPKPRNIIKPVHEEILEPNDSLDFLINNNCIINIINRSITMKESLKNPLVIALEGAITKAFSTTLQTYNKGHELIDPKKLSLVLTDLIGKGFLRKSLADKYGIIISDIRSNLKNAIDSVLSDHVGSFDLINFAILDEAVAEIIKKMTTPDQTKKKATKKEAPATVFPIIITVNSLEYIGRLENALKEVGLRGSVSATFRFLLFVAKTKINETSGKPQEDAETKKLLPEVPSEDMLIAGKKFQPLLSSADKNFIKEIKNILIGFGFKKIKTNYVIASIISGLRNNLQKDDLKLLAVKFKEQGK